MHDHTKKTSYGAASEETGVKEAERRSSDRHMFTASAEVVELSSGARFSTRTTDLGPGGCFIDTVNPFCVGSKVQLLLRKGKTEFQTHGMVVYSQNGLGMGIAFSEINPAQQDALQEWLAEITGQTSPVHEIKRPGKAFEQNAHWLRSVSDRAALVRLIQLMITKGILTGAEGASVLVDPVL